MHCVAHFAEETCAERPANGDLETPSQDLEKGKTKTPFYEQTFLWRTEKSSSVSHCSKSPYFVQNFI